VDKNEAKMKETAVEPGGIFGVPLRQSITYANVAISLIDAEGKSYIYGYVPIVVAKCGVYLKEKGECTCDCRIWQS
jgi:GTPase-activating protein SAC7